MIKPREISNFSSWWQCLLFGCLSVTSRRAECYKNKTLNYYISIRNYLTFGDYFFCSEAILVSFGARSNHIWL